MEATTTAAANGGHGVGAGPVYGSEGAVDLWTDEVDDLVDSGDVPGAIAFLQGVIARLEVAPSTSPQAIGDLRLAAALGDLADLYASRGFTLRSDELLARAVVLRSRAASAADAPAAAIPDSEAKTEAPLLKAAVAEGAENEEDDWEAIADRGEFEEAALPVEQEPKTASTSLAPPPIVKRGRGSFLYNKSLLYSDQQDEETDFDCANLADVVEQDAHEKKRKDKERLAQLGTRHVLVLYDFDPSTRTTDLEKAFKDFRDNQFAIRWVNDTTALAVFRSPSIAQEAENHVASRYKVRVLKPDDELLPQIDTGDLEPPQTRPKTSVSTAQRLIAHSIGLKPFASISTDKQKKQDEERKSRIIARQNLREDAWGPD